MFENKKTQILYQNETKSRAHRDNQRSLFFILKTFFSKKRDTDFSQYSKFWRKLKIWEIFHSSRMEKKCRTKAENMIFNQTWMIC